MQHVAKVDLRQLIYQINLELIAFLKQLTPEQWQLTTACAPWTVKDIVAHLWGGDIGRLAAGRDIFFRPNVPINSYTDLVGWINEQNALWVDGTSRLSPELLLHYLTDSNEQMRSYLLNCDMDADSIGVAWAGEMTSPLWFDIGREYTEKWMHQQHISEAVGEAGLIDAKWMHPALDIFMRGMPHAYRDVDASNGIKIQVNISGEAGGSWILQRCNNAWSLFTGSDQADAMVSLSQDTAWRLFTNGVSADEAQSLIGLNGNQQLGEHFLNLIAIMA